MVLPARRTRAPRKVDSAPVAISHGTEARASQPPPTNRAILGFDRRSSLDESIVHLPVTIVTIASISDVMCTLAHTPITESFVTFVTRARRFPLVLPGFQPSVDP